MRVFQPWPSLASTGLATGTKTEWPGCCLADALSRALLPLACRCGSDSLSADTQRTPCRFRQIPVTCCCTEAGLMQGLNSHRPGSTRGLLVFLLSSQHPGQLSSRQVHCCLTGLGLPGICNHMQSYAQICKKYARNMHKICKYAAIWVKYA